MYRSQKQIDRTIADLLTVFKALFNGVAEVKASENPRKCILLRSLGEAGVRAEYGRWIRAPLPGRQRKAARSEADVVGSEELRENLRRCTAFETMSRVVVGIGVIRLQRSPRGIPHCFRIAVVVGR